MARPTTVIAVLILVLVHALLLLGGTAASGVSLATFIVTHPDFGWSPSVLVPIAFGWVVNLVLVAGDIVLALRLWTAGRRARGLLTAWLGLSALITLVGVVSSFTRAATPSVGFATLWIVEVALCVGAVVLLWQPATTVWLGSRSVRPAGPGL